MKNRKKSFAKNTIILGIGIAFPKFVSIITLPIITARLTKIEYGTYDLVLTIMQLIIPIATLQLSSAAFRYLIDCNTKKEKSIIISTLWLSTLIMSVIACVCLFICSYNLPLYSRIVISLIFIFECIYNLNSQITRGLSSNKSYTVSAIIVSLINGAGIIICLAACNIGLNGILTSLLLAYVIANIYLCFKIKIYKYIHYSLYSKKTLANLLRYSWPMVPNNLSAWVLNLSDRMVINIFLGPEMMATYAVANKIPGFLTIFQQVFNLAWQENASQTVNDEDAELYYSNMLDSIFRILLGGTVFLIGCLPILFKILIKGNYESSYYQIPLLILSMFFCCMSSYMGGIYIAHKKTLKMGTTTILVAIFNLVVDLSLVNIIGITAGSLSTLLSYSLLYFYRLHDVQKIQKVRYNRLFQLSSIFIATIITFMSIENDILFNIANVIIGTIFFIVINKKVLSSIIPLLKRRVNEKN